MTLRGSVKEFPLEAVLRFIAASGKSGRLDLHGGRGSGAVGFENGRLVGAESGEDGGDAALGELFAIADGDFEFDLDASPTRGELAGGVEEIIERAKVERDRLVSIREVIPDDGLVFTLSDRAASRARIELTPDQWRALLAVNGDRDVSGVAVALGLRRRAALGLLAELVRGGTIDATPRPATSAPPPVAAPPPAPDAWSAPAREETRSSPAPEATEPPPTPAPARAEPDDWSPPVSSSPVSEPAPKVEEETWSAPVAEPKKEEAESWGVPWSTAAEQTEADTTARDDRLAALFGPAPAEAAPAEAHAPSASETFASETWDAPAPVSEPAPAAPDAPTVALPAAQDAAWVPQPPAPPPPAHAPAVEPAQERGGFFGFGAKKKETVIEQPAAAASAQTRTGKLALLTNALIAEYNSGRYGKGHLDANLQKLLLRVDEQADPVDRPVPTDGDTLSVSSLDSGVLPESQAVPYLALLVSQVYADAERTFGRDKAKQGYRAARQQALGKDAVLEQPDLAARLPRT